MFRWNRQRQEGSGTDSMVAWSAQNHRLLLETVKPSRLVSLLHQCF
jgi:hypothetical protein